MNPNDVKEVITKAIMGRSVLLIGYKHTSDGAIVEHKIAPFDIGTTNLKTRERNKDNVYAYSYTHLDAKTSLPNPKVCAFNIDSFLKIEVTHDFFDENELAQLNFQATKYDYRLCEFNVARDRAWFR